MESLEMVSPEYIQGLVDQAQEKIVNKDFQSVQTILWPEIKTALGHTTDLVWPDTEKIQWAIFKRLDESRLEGAEPKRIVLEELISDLPDLEEPPEDEEPFIWAPL